MGAYIADVIWGRYVTIVLFSVVYLIGLIVCGLAVLPDLLPQRSLIFFISLCGLVALGAGGIKPNVVVLGADQFHSRDDSIQKGSFFRWFYWTINLGSAFSFAVLANIATDPPSFITSKCAIPFVFAVICAVFALGLIVFVCGRKRYQRIPPAGSVVTRFFRMFVASGAQSFDGLMVVVCSALLLPGMALTVSSYMTHGSTSRILSTCGIGLIAVCVLLLMIFSRSTKWLRIARESLGGRFAGHEVTVMVDVVQLFPFFCFMVVFWAIYGQMQTNFVMQGCQLDARIGDGNYLLNASSLSVIDAFVILLLIPLFEKFLFPRLATHGIQFTTLQKIGVGFFFSALAMVAAGYVEVQRKHHNLIEYTPNAMPAQDKRIHYSGKNGESCQDEWCCNPNHFTGNTVINCSAALIEYGCHCIQVESKSYLTGCTQQPVAEMSIWYQSSQYVLIGISEIFTSTSSYELFYNHIPDTIKSVCQSLNLVTMGLGFMITGGMNSVLSFWISDNLNAGKLENIFFLLSGIMVVNLLGFVQVSRTFSFEREHEDEHQSHSHISQQPKYPIVSPKRIVNVTPGKAIDIQHVTNHEHPDSPYTQDVDVSPHFISGYTRTPESSPSPRGNDVVKL
eukprot:c6580_g1_i1.p1 GENE.c6580_g1_i1~~c6580_g1_i1.p1  ORF type:complete len:723 (+),score=138.32 c6580_g1_i1:308-2170(+)